MKKYLEESRKQLIQLGFTDQQIIEFDRMNERETKDFLRKELMLFGTDQQLEEFDRQWFKPCWHYYPWDPRSGRYGGTIMGILSGTAIFFVITYLMQN